MLNPAVLTHDDTRLHQHVLHNVAFSIAPNINISCNNNTRVPRNAYLCTLSMVNGLCCLESLAVYNFNALRHLGLGFPAFLVIELTVGMTISKLGEVLYYSFKRFSRDT